MNAAPDVVSIQMTCSSGSCACRWAALSVAVAGAGTRTPRGAPRSSRLSYRGPAPFFALLFPTGLAVCGIADAETGRVFTLSAFIGMMSSAFVRQAGQVKATGHSRPYLRPSTCRKAFDDVISHCNGSWTRGRHARLQTDHASARARFDEARFNFVCELCRLTSSSLNCLRSERYPDSHHDRSTSQRTC
jgi:hypothetical protein